MLRLQRSICRAVYNSPMVGWWGRPGAEPTTKSKVYTGARDWRVAVQAVGSAWSNRMGESSCMLLLLLLLLLMLLHSFSSQLLLACCGRCGLNSGYRVHLRRVFMHKVLRRFARRALAARLAHSFVQRRDNFLRSTRVACSALA
jgi:hypothetical protein